MKGKFTLLLAACSITLHVSSQVTIQPYASNRFIETDTLGIVKNLASFDTLNLRKSNALWDFRSVQYESVPLMRQRIKDTTGSYPNSLFVQNAIYPFNGALGLRIIQVMDTGYSEIVYDRIEIMDSQTFSLLPFSGNANDNLVIPAQKLSNQYPVTWIHYPMEYADPIMNIWYTQDNWKFNFNLTLTSEGLSNATGECTSYFSIIDTVGGWGNIKITSMFTGVTYEIPVLQVQHDESWTQMYTMNGNPMSNSVLSKMGTKQEERILQKATYFYRDGEIAPVVAVYYDRNDTRKPVRIEINQNRLDLNSTGISSVKNESTIMVFPNPVNDKIYFRIPDQSGNWSYSVSDLNGRVFRNVEIKDNAGDLYSVDVSDLINGNYVLTICNNGTPVRTQKLILAH
ncbi:MAG: T9SS type A sorting domain-containing protein [Bacteroidetes bacterium]|nr:T9SS type A sorting domain-containing protein [Bacteroidota bacterium]